MRKLIGASLVLACLLAWHGPASAQAGLRGALPHVIVYKTKRDYRQNVPVELSKDKKTVVSYPGPADVKMGNTYVFPVLLHKGYLLDKRGVGINTAFIKLTYKEYSQLKAPPTPQQLYHMIIDKDPIIELYDCGMRNQQKNSETQLNLSIDNGRFKREFKRVK